MSASRSTRKALPVRGWAVPVVPREGYAGAEDEGVERVFRFPDAVNARAVEAVEEDGEARLVEGGNDHVVRVVDPLTGKELRRSAKTAGNVQDLAMSEREGRRVVLAVCYQSQRVQVYDFETLEELESMMTTDAGELWAVCSARCPETGAMVAVVGSHAHVLACVKVPGGEVLWARELDDRVEGAPLAGARRGPWRRPRRPAVHPQGCRGMRGRE